jgi:membrane protease YdiL (CAAX protease family)
VPAWAPFVALTLLLVVAVLSLASRSADLLREPTTDAAEPRHPPRKAAGPTNSASALSPRVLLANVVLTQGLLIAIVAGAIVVFEIPLGAVGIGGGPLVWGVDGLGLGLGLGLVLWLGSEAAGRLADVAGISYDERLRERLAPDSTLGWVGLFVLVLPLVAAGEELLFRGALIGVTAAGFGVSPWLLAGVSTVAFALGHGAQGRVGIAATAVLGAVLAGAFVVTGSLLVVGLAHYVVNALEFAVHEAR